MLGVTHSATEETLTDKDLAKLVFCSTVLVNWGTTGTFKEYTKDGWMEMEGRRHPLEWTGRLWVLLPFTCTDQSA